MLEPDVVTFLGTWRFGVDSPKYGRQVMVSIIHDEQDHQRAKRFVKDSYPTFDARPMVILIPEPSHEQARLFEVMPYPKLCKIFPPPLVVGPSMWRTPSDLIVGAVLGLVALLVGCSGFPMQSEPVVVKRAQMQMGTLVSITVVAGNETCRARCGDRRVC